MTVRVISCANLRWFVIACVEMEKHRFDNFRVFVVENDLVTVGLLWTDISAILSSAHNVYSSRDKTETIIVLTTKWPPQALRKNSEDAQTMLLCTFQSSVPQ